MGAARIVIRPLGQPGDLGWVVMAHGQVYVNDLGWNPVIETLAARIVADYGAGHDPAREAAWIAEVDGRRVGCVFCVAAGDDTSQLRILLVDPSARGQGVGGGLVDECIAFARRAGYARMKLWTNHTLDAARRIYLSRGFRQVEEEPHQAGGVRLMDQAYELDLRAGGEAARDAGASARSSR